MSRPDDRGEGSASDAPLRCFVAVDLDEPTRATVAAYLGELRTTIPGVAWTHPENLHLTIAFLGDVLPARIPSLTDRLATMVGGIGVFTARVMGVGAFPSLSRPQVLWVGIAAAALAVLATAVQAACEQEGFPRERRPFRPHVTLGRLRSRAERSRAGLAVLARDGGRDFGSTAITRVVLYRSVLDRAGARHFPIATFPLAER